MPAWHAVPILPMPPRVGISLFSSLGATLTLKSSVGLRACVAGDTTAVLCPPEPASTPYNVFIARWKPSTAL